MKKELGIYYTELFNPFEFDFFKEWVEENKLAKEVVLEPFAGANSIIDMLRSVDYAEHYFSYDLFPKNKKVVIKDTIKNFPLGHNFCVTNPPWLYKSRARRLDLPFPDTSFDDLYKHCLALCLANCNFVAALIPASFLQARLFLDRLDLVSVITKKLFYDTDNPVCLALFSDKISDDFLIYENDSLIGFNKYLKRKYLPTDTGSRNVVFNDERGELGFIAIDNTTEASIKFCLGSELENYDITHSSRSITRVRGIEASSDTIAKLNYLISDFRYKTQDVFLTPFKGLRKDGKYRRRMDYKIARRIMQNV